MKKKFEFPEMEAVLFQEEPIMDSTTLNANIGLGSAQQDGLNGNFTSPGEFL